MIDQVSLSNKSLLRMATRHLNKFGSVLALALVFAFFATLNAKMASLAALETMVQQTVIVGMAALGMTLVIISAGIDLSVGSIIAFASVAVASLIDSLGLSPGQAAIGALSTAPRRPRRGRSPEQKRIRQLERELDRKDKALAETAALLVMLKKAEALWGDEGVGTREKSAKKRSR